MKKLLSLLCVLSLSAALLAGCSTAGDAGTSETPGSSSTPSEVTEPGSSQETVDSLDVNVMALKGPTAMGMVKMMADSEPVEEFTDQLKEEYENVVSSGNIYHFTITSATDEVSAALAQGTTDIAAVPANLASVLYNNTEGGVQVLAINTLGVLYIVESGDTVHSVEDLRGKTIYASGKGNTPEAALEQLRSGEKCSCVLLEKLQISQSTLSYHMKILCDSGVVVGRAEGKWTHYGISEEGSRYAKALLDTLTQTNTCENGGCGCQK